MLRHPWRAAAASATVIGSSAYLYHAYSRRPRAAHQDSFDLPVRSSLAGPDGKRAYTTQAIPLLAMSDVDMRIRAYASSRAVARPGGIVWKHASAQLASNSPIEDARADAIVERDPAPGASASDGDYLFFSVMDGHGGPHTSRLLAKTLIPAVALQLHELAQMQSTCVPRLEKAGWLDGIYSLLSSESHKPHTRHVSFAADPTYVSLAIQTAFAMADSEIVNAPLRLIAEHLAQSKSSDPAPDLSQHPMALPSMLPALSGSCALLALLDTAHRDLYVACTGDCRAVAGVWEEAPDGTGTWRVEVLSEDQTGRNQSELKRMQSEHPQEEASTVIQRGRVLGGLEPSRAFGDARYKWPFKVQQLLARVFLDGNNQPMRRPPADFKTPPYVTAQPVITHRKLDFLPLSETGPPMPFPASSPPPPTSGSLPPSTAASNSAPVPAARPTAAEPARPALRFLVLATDGLWDQLSSRDAVALVAGHLAGLRAPAVSRAELAARAPTRLGSPGVEGKNKGGANANERDGGGAAEGHAWAFVDADPAAHLVRNAFGGGDTARLRQLLSIPAPLSRRYRDDVTVTVVWWEDGRAEQARVERLNVPGRSAVDGEGTAEARARAKL